MGRKNQECAARRLHVSPFHSSILFPLRTKKHGSSKDMPILGVGLGYVRLVWDRLGR